MMVSLFCHLAQLPTTTIDSDVEQEIRNLKTSLQEKGHVVRIIYTTGTSASLESYRNMINYNHIVKPE